MLAKIQFRRTALLLARGSITSRALLSLRHRRSQQQHLLGTSSSPFDNVVASSKVMWQKTRETFTKFGQGVKGIVVDGRVAWNSYHKLTKEDLRKMQTSPAAGGAGSDEGGGGVFLRLRREYRHLRETIFGLAKLLPLIILWIPPGIGLLPPVLFVYFPRQLFTRHFWSMSEKEEYARLQYQEKALYYPVLRDALAASLSGAESKKISSECMKLCSIKEKEVLFHEGQKAGIGNLSTSHVRMLAQAVQINKFMWMTQVLPASYLRWCLRRRATEVFIDDLMLRASGTKELTAEELRDACDLRGLPALGSAKEELLRAQLQSWLSLYDRLASPSSGDDGDKQAQAKEMMTQALQPAVAKHYWIWWPGRCRAVYIAAEDRYSGPSSEEWQGAAAADHIVAVLVGYQLLGRAGHGKSDEALASLLEAAKAKTTSMMTTTTTGSSTDIMAQSEGLVRIGVPAPSLLLHLPALLDPVELVPHATGDVKADQQQVEQEGTDKKAAAM